MPRRDWIGHWLSLVDRRGELMDIRYGRVDAPPAGAMSGSGASAGVTWRLLSHARFDGLGGLGALLDEHGTPPRGGLPEARGLPALSALGKLTAFARSFGGGPTPAKLFDQDRGWRAVPGDRERARPAAESIAFHLFSAGATTALLTGARAAGITLNSLLLWALGRAAAAEMIPGSGEQVWLVPINMRGLVRQAVATENHIAFMNVPVPAAHRPEEVHASVRGRIDRGAHWGAWLTSNLGEILGERGVEAVARAQDPARASAVGAFSNLGALEGDGEDAWLFCPPVTLAQPLGAGAITWNGRLSLLVQVHPSVKRGAGEVGALVRRWRDEAMGAFAAR